MIGLVGGSLVLVAGTNDRIAVRAFDRIAVTVPIVADMVIVCDAM